MNELAFTCVGLQLQPDQCSAHRWPPKFTRLRGAASLIEKQTLVMKFRMRILYLLTP